MLVRINPKGAGDFASEIGQYNVITKKLQVWFSRIYMASGTEEIALRDFDIPEDVEKIELVDNGGLETLAVPVNVFKEAHVDGKGFVFNYPDWKKKYLKPF